MSVLPKGWTRATLGELTTYLSRGKSPRYAEHSELPVVNQRAIRWQGIESEHLKYVDPTQFGVWGPERFIHPGDLLWNSTGTGTIGRACLVSSADIVPPKVVDSHVTIVRPDPELLDSRYLWFWVRSSEVQRKISELSTGTTNQIELNRGTIAAMSVPLAPRREQVHVSDKLVRLTSRLAQCEERLARLLKLIRQFRDAVLEAAVTGRLTDQWRMAVQPGTRYVRFERDSNVFGAYKIPSSWSVSLLCEVADISGGITKDAKRQSDDFEELPYLRVANVQRGYLNLDEVKTIRVPPERVSGLLLNKGDILFTEGGDLDKLGRGCVWDGEISRCVFQNHIFRARLKDNTFAPKFFSHFANSRGYAYFLAFGKQTTNLASINKSVLSSLPVPVPSPLEQDEIVRRVEGLFALADALERRSLEARSRVEMLSPSILEKAFSGQLVSQDPADESATFLLDRVRKKRLDEQDIPHRRVRRTTSTPKQLEVERIMKRLVDVLRGAKGWVPAEEAFRRCGVANGTSTVELENLYAQLRELDKTGILESETIRDRRGRKVSDRLRLRSAT